MLEMNIKYNSHNSVTVLGYFFKMPLISGWGGGALLSGGQLLS